MLHSHDNPNPIPPINKRWFVRFEKKSDNTVGSFTNQVKETMECYSFSITLDTFQEHFEWIEYRFSGVSSKMIKCLEFSPKHRKNISWWQYSILASIWSAEH